MIGTLGRKIIFEVSDNRVLTFESMSREVSGRWTEHEVLGVKPKAEFLGPGLQTISLTIHLSAALGVKPRRILDMVERMVERGSADWWAAVRSALQDRVKPGTRFTAAENWPRLP